VLSGSVSTPQLLRARDCQTEISLGWYVLIPLRGRFSRFHGGLILAAPHDCSMLARWVSSDRSVAFVLLFADITMASGTPTLRGDTGQFACLWPLLKSFRGLAMPSMWDGSGQHRLRRHASCYDEPGQNNQAFSTDIQAC